MQMSDDVRIRLMRRGMSAMRRDHQRWSLRFVHRTRSTEATHQPSKSIPLGTSTATVKDTPGIKIQRRHKIHDKNITTDGQENVRKHTARHHYHKETGFFVSHSSGK